jgi:hypothetical protein
MLPASSSSRLLRGAVTGSQALFGLAFLIFGLDGFLHFFPVPDPSTIPEGAASFGSALAATGYMFQLIKGTELVVGALLLANRFVPLALTLLAPVMVNIVLFHAFLAPSGIGLALVFAGMHLFLAWTRRHAFAALLRARP